MDLPTKKDNASSEDNLESQESLSAVKKKLETGGEIPADGLKEIKARNLAQIRDTLNNDNVGTVINVKQGQGVVNINTGTVNNLETQAKKSIPTDFFLKQKGLTSSKVPYKGGRL